MFFSFIFFFFFSLSFFLRFHVARYELSSRSAPSRPCGSTTLTTWAQLWLGRESFSPKCRLSLSATSRPRTDGTSWARISLWTGDGLASINSQLSPASAQGLGIAIPLSIALVLSLNLNFSLFMQSPTQSQYKYPSPRPSLSPSLSPSLVLLALHSKLCVVWILLF